MKTFMMSLTMITAMLLAMPLQSQAQECENETAKKKEKKVQSTECTSQEAYTKTSFQVDGNCSMCKDRIEKAAKSVKGVEKATWDKENDQLTLAYHKEKVKLTDVHDKVAAAGHDTKKVAATDEAYQALPMCCKYREE